MYTWAHFQSFQNGLESNKSDFHSTRKDMGIGSFEGPTATATESWKTLNTKAVAASRVRSYYPSRVAIPPARQHVQSASLSITLARSPQAQFFVLWFVTSFCGLLSFFVYAAFLPPMPANIELNGIEMLNTDVKLDCTDIPRDVEVSVNESGQAVIVGADSWLYVVCDEQPAFCESIWQPIHLRFRLNSNVSIDYSFEFEYFLNKIELQMQTTSSVPDPNSMCLLSFFALHQPAKPISPLGHMYIVPIKNQSTTISPPQNFHIHRIKMLMNCFDSSNNFIFGDIFFHKVLN